MIPSVSGLRGSAALLVLAGCPFLFEPPDESNVPDLGDADTDADTDADSDSDSDTDAIPGNAPSIPSFVVAPRLSKVVVHFSVADLESDLVGGSLDFTDGETHWILAIPGEVLPTWDPQGVSTVDLPTVLPIACTGRVSQDWSMTATDLAGHVSQPAEFHLEIPSVGVQEEDGERWPAGHILTEVPPLAGCIEYEDTPGSPDPLQKQLREDFEGIVFTTPSTGNYIVNLDWDHDNPFDSDIRIYYLPVINEDGDGFYDTIVTAISYGDVGEEAVFPAAGNDQWLCDFTFWEFFPQSEVPYRATFLVTPE